MSVLRRVLRVALTLAVGLGVAEAAARTGAGTWLPPGVIFNGIVGGMLTALIAVGVVLVYRSSRIINFAAVSIGALGAITFALLAYFTPLGWFVSAIAGVAVAAGTGYLVEVMFLRRFADAPRLVLTVVTAGLNSLLGLALLLIVTFLANKVRARAVRRVSTPFGHLHFKLAPLQFTGDHLAAIVVPAIALGAIAWFLSRTSAGISIRAMAENRDRVALLGINVNRLSRVVWMIVGGLAGLSYVLIFDLSGQGGGGSGIAIAPAAFLAAAVIARMQDLPEAAAAAVALALVERGVTWGFTSPAYVDGAMFAIVIVALLAQRRVLQRVAESLSGSWAGTEEARPIPPELTALASVRRGVRRLWIASGLIVLGLPWVLSPSQTRVLDEVAVLAVVGVSLVILTGWGGQISLGQMGFAGFGGAVGSTLYATYHWPFLLATLVAALSGAALAVAIGIPALRVRGLFLAVATFVFAIAVRSLVLNHDLVPGKWIMPTERVNRPALFGFGGEDERTFFYFCVAGLLLAIYLAVGLRRSRTGRVLIAMRDNERAAQSFGVNLTRTRLLTFALSGFMAAYAGMLYAVMARGVAAANFGAGPSLEVFFMTVIGGLGSLAGAVTGAVYLALNRLLPDFGSFGLVGRFARLLITPGAGVVLVLMFFPRGLAGDVLYRMRDAVLRRVAARHRLYVPSLLADYRREDRATERHPLPKRADDEGRVTRVPVQYRLPSTVRTLGRSQRDKIYGRSA